MKKEKKRGEGGRGKASAAEIHVGRDGVLLEGKNGSIDNKGRNAFSSYRSNIFLLKIEI